MRVMTGDHLKNKKEIEHNTLNFVDDSASVVSFIDENDMKNYVELFMATLEEYYNINKLKINKKKTVIIVFKGAKSEKDVNEIEFKINETESVKPVVQHRVLGWIVNQRLSMDDQLAKTIKAANLK